MALGLRWVYKSGDKAVILGMSGVGKTTLLVHLIRQLQERRIRGIVVDTVGNLMQLRNPMLVVEKNNCLHDITYPCLHFYDPNAFNIFIQNYVINQHNLSLFIDEIDHYILPRRIEYWTHVWLQEGRNWGLGGIFTVRQVGLLNKEILSNSRWLFLFRIVNANDIKYLQGIVDFNVKEIVNKLKRFQFALIDMYGLNDIQYGTVPRLVL